MKNFLINYNEQVQRWERTLPVQQLNNMGFRHLMNQDWPSKKQEAWKYTNLNHIKNKEMLWLSPPSKEQCLGSLNKIHNLLNKDTIYLFDGHFISGLSDRSLNSCCNIEIIRPDHEEFNKKLSLFNDVGIGPSDAFRSMNSAFVNNLLIIIFKKQDKKIQLKIQNIETQSSSQNSFSTPRTLLYFEEDANVSCEVLYSSQKTNLVNAILDIHLAEGAQLDLIVEVKPEESKSMFLSQRVQMEKKSFLNVSTLVFGSQLSRVDQYIFSDGENTNTHIAFAYISENSQEVDITSSMNHQCPKGISVQRIKGMAKDQARANINGCIYIQQDAQEVSSEYLNKNMLLSERAEINTRPQLEVEADNVKAAHGATVSQLDVEEIFYLESRGISKEQAIQLLLKGYIFDAFKNLKDKDSQIFKSLEAYFEQ
ncbi:MAG: SufD family Fe-S cluster assembly protein [Bdellovibrionaceae bacterium]|nr:SufD family Fe-S cluster assembly protein [Pseudobdellovibrionaceae bacterium]